MHKMSEYSIVKSFKHLYNEQLTRICCDTKYKVIIRVQDNPPGSSTSIQVEHPFGGSFDWFVFDHRFETCSAIKKRRITSCIIFFLSHSTDQPKPEDQIFTVVAPGTSFLFLVDSSFRGLEVKTYGTLKVQISNNVRFQIRKIHVPSLKTKQWTA